MLKQRWIVNHRCWPRSKKFFHPPRNYPCNLSAISVEDVNVPRNDPEYVAERRRIIRENHPDRGGSDQALIRALQQLDEQWDRKLRLRKEIRENLPSFIPEDVAMQAFDQADRWAGRVRDGADQVRRRLDDRSGNGDFSRRLGRTVGTVRKRIGEEFDKRRR